MESYLSGRTPDADPPTGNDSQPFRSYVQPSDDDVSSHLPRTVPPGDETSQTLLDEPGGPKVEIVSVEGRVTRIVVHLENDKVLNVHCEY